MTQSWNDYFKELVLKAKTRSKDSNTQVGVIIVDKDNRIISTGYNGLPKGMPDKPEYWKKPDKYEFVVHAEANAILHSDRDLTGCKMYVTLSPCNECAKLIASKGISEVYYVEERPNEYTDIIFKECRVRMEAL